MPPGCLVDVLKIWPQHEDSRYRISEGGAAPAEAVEMPPSDEDCHEVGERSWGSPRRLRVLSRAMRIKPRRWLRPGCWRARLPPGPRAEAPSVTTARTEPVKTLHA